MGIEFVHIAIVGLIFLIVGMALGATIRDAVWRDQCDKNHSLFQKGKHYFVISDDEKHEKHE